MFKTNIVLAQIRLFTFTCDLYFNMSQYVNSVANKCTGLLCVLLYVCLRSNFLTLWLIVLINHKEIICFHDLYL